MNCNILVFFFLFCLFAFVRQFSFYSSSLGSRARNAKKKREREKKKKVFSRRARARAKKTMNRISNCTCITYRSDANQTFSHYFLIKMYTKKNIDTFITMFEYSVLICVQCLRQTFFSLINRQMCMRTHLHIAWFSSEEKCQESNCPNDFFLNFLLEISSIQLNASEDNFY